ncbi:MAG: ABC transporter substrate-binding protein [Candidatus Omnitrophica bacterium]|nr:ABC transporter substrate-binding protein [Candidatus Omnitrophota bacterium]
MLKIIKYIIIFLFMSALFSTYFFLSSHNKKNKPVFKTPVKPPQRIISLGTSITEELFLLGEGHEIIGDTIYDVKPKQAKSIEKVGSVTEINVEKIVRLKPDIVFATSLTDPREKEEIKKLGIKVITFSEPESFNQICSQFLELGKTVGKQQKAENIINKSKQEVNLLRKKVKNLPKKKVFVELGTNPLFAATGNTFINDFITFAGGINIAQNAGSGIYSREEVIKQNPDVIIVADMGFLTNDEKKMWKRYRTINAVKNHKIFGINSYQLDSPTPETFPKTLKKLIYLIQGKNI